MNKIILVLTLFIFGCVSTALRAEDAPLTWDVCAKEALAHNPDLQKAAANLQSAKYGKKGAVSSFLPSLSANASANKSGNEGSLAGILKDGDAASSYQMGLNAQINLFNGFKDKASFNLASIAQQQAEVQCLQQPPVFPAAGDVVGPDRRPRKRERPHGGVELPRWPREQGFPPQRASFFGGRRRPGDTSQTFTLAGPKAIGRVPGPL
jgi:hypothetical protein